MAIRYLDEPQPKSRIRYLDEPTQQPEAELFSKPAINRSPTYGGAEGVRRFAMFGPTGYGTTPGSEDVLPTAGQTAGGRFGLTAAGGAAAGEIARQGIKAVRGDASGIKNPMKFGLGAVGIPEAVPSAGTEAAMTGTIEGAFRGAGKIAKPVANRLMNSVIKPGREVLKKNPEFGVQALEAGVYGSKSGMLNKAENLIDEGENALTGVLKSKGGNVDISKVASELEDLKRPFLNIGDDASVKAIEEVQANLVSKGSLGLEEANQLKRDLYTVIKDSQFGKGVGDVASKTSARKKAAYGIKNAIEGVAPEVKGINKKIGLGVESKKALENSLASQQQRVIFPKLAGMGAGATALAGNPLAAAGILLGDRGVDLFRSAPVVTGTAKNIMRLKKFGAPVSIGAGEISRRLREAV